MDKHQNTQNPAEIQDQPSVSWNGADPDPLDAAEAALADYAAKYGPLDLAAKTALGDARDLVLELFHEQREGWQKLSEKQQRYINERVEDRLRTVIHRLVDHIAAHEFPAIAVTLEQLAFKPKGIEAKLAMNAIDRATRHQLVDAQGKPVLIVIADPAAFMGARGAAKIDKQAPELPLDAAEPNGEAVGPLSADEASVVRKFRITASDGKTGCADDQLPETADDWRRGADGVAPVHREAEQTGREDGLRGDRDHAARWPAGVYGHADYETGHALGENERSALMATARELGAVAGKAGAGEESNPYASSTAEHDLWLAGWTSPEPGNNGGHVEPEDQASAPRRRGRPPNAGGASGRAVPP